MNQRWNILLKGLAAIGAIIIICISITKLTGIGSETLGDIAREHPQPTATPRVTEEDPCLQHRPEWQRKIPCLRHHLMDLPEIQCPRRAGLSSL